MGVVGNRNERESAIVTPFRFSHELRTAIKHRSRPIKLIGSLQVVKQEDMDFLPGAISLPITQVPPTSHPQTAALIRA